MRVVWIYMQDQELPQQWGSLLVRFVDFVRNAYSGEFVLIVAYQNNSLSNQIRAQINSLNLPFIQHFNGISIAFSMSRGLVATQTGRYIAVQITQPGNYFILTSSNETHDQTAIRRIYRSYNPNNAPIGVFLPIPNEGRQSKIEDITNDIQMERPNLDSPIYSSLQPADNNRDENSVGSALAVIGLDSPIQAGSLFATILVVVVTLLSFVVSLDEKSGFE